jgi:hypothetical protein
MNKNIPFSAIFVPAKTVNINKLEGKEMLNTTPRAKFLILTAKIILQVCQICIDPYLGCAFSIALILVEWLMEKETTADAGSENSEDIQ